MKTVYFIRHAKSSWANMDMMDVDRPLNKRGLRDAPLMAKKLEELISADKEHVDGIISSYAKRTRETLIPFQEVFRLESETTIEKNLYHASSETIIESLYGLKESWNSCLLFAHNPGISYLLGDISSNFDSDVPTCGIFKVRFEADNWNEVDVNLAKVEFFIYPKKFKE